MRQTALTKMGGPKNVFFIGEVAKVPVADVDKSKVDYHTLTGVIVQINHARMVVRVVMKAGLLQSWYQYHRLSRVQYQVVRVGDSFSRVGVNEGSF